MRYWSKEGISNRCEPDPKDLGEKGGEYQNSFDELDYHKQK